MTDDDDIYYAPNTDRSEIRFVLKSEYDKQAEAIRVMREALVEAKAQVIELCQTHGHPLPAASIERYNAALKAADEILGER